MNKDIIERNVTGTVKITYSNNGVLEIPAENFIKDLEADLLLKQERINKLVSVAKLLFNGLEYVANDKSNYGLASTRLQHYINACKNAIDEANKILDEKGKK